MNKADLIEALAPTLGGRARAAAAVEALVDSVMRHVAAGESVVISGFGTFEKVDRAPRTGRNPRTGEAVPIAATSSPRFRPGAYFKDVVSDPSLLPATGLAGARIGSGSIAEDAPARTAAAPARKGAPATVRRTRPAPAKKAAAAPADPRVLSSGEEITQEILSSKKAQLARVKSDELDKAAARSGKGAKADKDAKAEKDSDKDSGKKSKKGKKAKKK